MEPLPCGLGVELVEVLEDDGAVADSGFAVTTAGATAGTPKGFALELEELGTEGGILEALGEVGFEVGKSGTGEFLAGEGVVRTTEEAGLDAGAANVERVGRTRGSGDEGRSGGGEG
jgi:hypothetical protein